MSHAIEPTIRRQWLKHLFFSMDRPFRLAANLTFLGVLGSVVGAYVQYNSWWNEKNLARYREELASAITSFSEISGQLSSVMNLQQILYFTYKNAFNHFGIIDPETRLFLARNGNKTYGDYVVSRTALRKQIDVLLGKAELFIDLPMRPDSRRIEASAEDLLMISNRDSLRHSGFNCEQHVPDPSRSKLKLARITIDWNSAKDHVAALYYCLEELHTALLPVRVWAEAANPINPEEGDLPKLHADFAKQMDAVETAMSSLTSRLNSFISLSTSNIESIRLRIRPGFFRYQFCWYC